MYYFLKCTPHIKLFIFLFTVHMCGSHFCVFLQHYVVGFSLLSGARWWVVGGAVGDGRRVGWLGGAGLSGLHASVERTSKCCCSIESIKLPTITLKSRASISWSQQLVDCEWIGVKEMRRPNKNVQLNEKLSTWPSASANRRKIFDFYDGYLRSAIIGKHTLPQVNQIVSYIYFQFYYPLDFIAIQSVGVLK